MKTWERVLELLAENEEQGRACLTAPEIADRLDLDIGSTTSALFRLRANKGYVQYAGTSPASVTTWKVTGSGWDWMGGRQR